MTYATTVLLLLLITSLHAAILPSSFIPRPPLTSRSSKTLANPSHYGLLRSHSHRAPLSQDAGGSDEYNFRESADSMSPDSSSVRATEVDSEAEEEDSDDDGIEEDSDQSEDDSDSEERDSAQDAENQVEKKELSERTEQPLATTSQNRLSVSKSVRASTSEKSKKQSRTFKGVPLDVVDGTNVTHLSYMVFKLIKTHEIKSVVDIPCRNTLSWFPQLLHYLDFEILGFKYYCIDSEKHSQDDIRGLFSDAASPEFMHIRPEEASLLPKADLVFSWDGPQQWGVRKTWSFFTALRQIRPKYLMITNNPGAQNTDDKRGLINLRKQPFHVRRTSSVSLRTLIRTVFMLNRLTDSSSVRYMLSFFLSLTSLVWPSHEGYISGT